MQKKMSLRQLKRYLTKHYGKSYKKNPNMKCSTWYSAWDAYDRLKKEKVENNSQII